MICQDFCKTVPKPDNRGKHWKLKSANDKAPTPWIHTKEWADKRCRKEADFGRLVMARNIIYTLPWQRSTPCARVIGNTNKVLFMELLSHHINQIAKLSFVDESAGFLGIASVHVAAESRPAFDAGLVPSVEGKRRTGSIAQIKTLVKIWSTAGFVERVLEDGSLIFTFDRATFDRMRAQAQRADDRRRACKPDVKKNQVAPSSPMNSDFSQVAAQTHPSLGQSAESGAPAPTVGFLAHHTPFAMSIGMLPLPQAAEETRCASHSPAGVADSCDERSPRPPVARPASSSGSSATCHAGILHSAASIGLGGIAGVGARDRAEDRGTPDSGGGARKVARHSVECRDALSAAAAAASISADPAASGAAGKSASGLVRRQAAEEVARAARLAWQTAEASAVCAAAEARRVAAEARRAAAELRVVMAEERAAAAAAASLRAAAGPVEAAGSGRG
jgi:hypothetical protein